MGVWKKPPPAPHGSVIAQSSLAHLHLQPWAKLLAKPGLVGPVPKSDLSIAVSMSLQSLQYICTIITALRDEKGTTEALQKCPQFTGTAQLLGDRLSLPAPETRARACYLRLCDSLLRMDFTVVQSAGQVAGGYGCLFTS